MAIVTISRQFGAPGRPVGLELARRMGAEFLDRQLVAAVATRAGIPLAEAEDLDERVPSRWQRLAAALTVGVPDPVMPPVPASVAGDLVARGDLSAPERLAALTRTVIEEAADRGSVVILGRGGAFVLKGRPDAVHVQLHADIDARVRSLVDRVAEIPVEEIPDGTRPDEASLRDLCRDMDARRAAYIRHHFGADWLDSSHYHLAIDGGRLPRETIVETILVAVGSVTDWPAGSTAEAAADAPG
jgi:cytidylate kinase